MSSKSAKRSAASSSAGASSHQTPQVPPSTSSGVQSPMTPTRMSRIMEKNTLASLNDRLAAYIERNQYLENENSVITKQLSKSEENTTRTVSRIQSTYEKELMDARKLVDETAKDKQNLTFHHSQLKKDFDDIKAKFDKKTKDSVALQRNLTTVEAQLNDLQAQNNKALADRAKFANENKDLSGEVARLAREVEDLRRLLEQESMIRVDLENQLKGKTEELNFKNQLHESEVIEIKSRRQVEIQEVDGRLQQEYELKLQQSLQELRAEYEGQLRANKEELDNLYEQKVVDLRAQLKRIQSTAASKSDEISSLTDRVEVVTQTVTRLEVERSDLQMKIKILEKKLDDDHSRFAKLLSDRDAEIESLMGEKTQLMNDYQDLMDTKVALDNEIATYRKLLEGEERRLSISPRQGHLRGGTPAGGRRNTPLRNTKRKRYEEETVESAAEYDTNAVSHGEIEILEDDPEGKYIRLHNKGEKEVSLSGWQLLRRAGGNDTTHKFHRQMKLDSKATVTVWSSDIAGGVHEPPISIVMKGQKWFSADHVHTSLTSAAGEEVAVRETRRLQVSHQRKRLGYSTGAEDLFHQEPEPLADPEAERCIIS